MIEVSIAYDKRLNALPDFAQLLFFKVLPHTDDFGRFEGDPDVVKARVDPLSTKPVAKYVEAMRMISQNSLWLWYSTPDGRKVIQYNKESFDRINAFLIKQRGNDEFPGYKESYELIYPPNEPITNREYKVESRKQKEGGVGGDEKRLHADDVLLTSVEFATLVDVHGEIITKEAISVLSNYKGSSGKKYKSDYKAILNWAIERAKENIAKKTPTKMKWIPPEQRAKL